MAVLHTRKHHIPFSIDDEDVERVSKHTWYVGASDWIVTNYVENFRSTTVSLQIFLLGRAPEGKRWTFINGDKTDCRRENILSIDKKWKYKIPGIYSIFSIVENKSYFGSSSDIYHRWLTERWGLRHRIGKNIQLQKAWNEYGEDSFEFKILVIISDPDELIRLEQWFIDNNDCYNMRPAGNQPGFEQSNRGLRHWEPRRKLI